MSREGNFQDEATATAGDGAGASALMDQNYQTTVAEDNTNFLSFHDIMMEWLSVRPKDSFHYEMVSDTIQVPRTVTPATQNLMDDPSYVASGESTALINETFDSGYEASRGESVNSVSDPMYSGNRNQRTIVSQETNSETDVYIHEQTEGDEPVSIADRRRRNRILRGHSQFSNHQPCVMFTYPLEGVDDHGHIINYDIVQSATIIAPSGASYCRNNNPPKFFPTFFCAIVPLNVNSVPYGLPNADDAYSFSPYSQTDQSDEFISDQGFDETSINEENSDETE